jgi:hypothetical protein
MNDTSALVSLRSAAPVERVVETLSDEGLASRQTQLFEESLLRFSGEAASFLGGP